ncbi:ANTAR domain-containing protein [Streptomyces axinellae]|uniref:GAF and ANTAR domain-containing protein n=1 Tax=Streptomyces axinellae TaxID=552788 RepID=A0ABN3QHG3_9ACTN
MGTSPYVPAAHTGIRRPPLEPGERPEDASLGRSLADLAERAARFSPECCGAIATFSDAGAEMPPAPGGQQVAVTHPDLTPLVTVQRECGEGPIPTALATGRLAGGDDLLYAERWDAYRARALEAGLRSSTTLSYRRGGMVLTLTVCSFRPHRMDEDVRAGTALLGDLAASLLVRDVRYRAALDEVEQLDTALRSRPVVDRACGIIMAVTGCSADEAFSVLRRLSQHGNRKLHDLADAVVRTRGRGMESELRRLGRTP